ncbi:M48 family metallopeptidase [Pseudorhodoferax sp. Leaf267]|uniref:M48 family metallopeptidase n=1 Tax=Pseudorhodoferax sp. Leaf267 TaxID=1736316 RepID=UPI0006F4FF1E|nr:M48 family metallopeptidase [Pseudorhodoferax sp. Leaf267]KQP11805.1 peptidase M48 [Pseudorhodoferax sp. Leaf267]
MKNARTSLAMVCLGAALLGAPAAFAQREGVDIGENSAFTRLVSAAEMEQVAEQQYRQVLREAQQQGALAPASNPQLQRLRVIAERIIPHALDWNPRAKDWRWEVNLIGSKQINAWCMPGGKIAFYTGILSQLKLTDDEIAAVMGHEIAHALREHARERAGKNAATNIGASILSQILGAGAIGQQVIGGGAQLLSLSFSRDNELQADLVGLELAARAGYDPRAGITLWNKMSAASKGAPPQWLSTHPAGRSRIAEIERNLPKVMPLYERAKRSS